MWREGKLQFIALLIHSNNDKCDSAKTFRVHIKLFQLFRCWLFWGVSFYLFSVFSKISWQKVCASILHRTIMYSTTSATVNLTHSVPPLVPYYLETQLQKDVKCIKDKEAEVENKRWSGKGRRSWGREEESIQKHKYCKHTHTHTHRGYCFETILTHSGAFNTILEFRVQTSWKHPHKNFIAFPCKNIC